MENKIYNDDVERIVNDAVKSRKAEKMKKMEKKRKNMFYSSIISACAGLIFALFGIVGWMDTGLAFILFFVFVMYATFRFGRWLENCKCWGWK